MHRTQSYNEFSLRYSEAIELFYVPELERVSGPDPNNKQGSMIQLEPISQDKFVNLLAENNEMSWVRYQEALKLGVSNELARMLLPVNIYTKFRAQANLRNWFHFLNLRMRDNAQYEIRVTACAVYEIIKQLWPKCSEVFDEHTFGAVKFSKTEIEILREILASTVEYEEGSLGIEQIIGDKLNKSRVREFKTKLGIKE